MTSARLDLLPCGYFWATAWSIGSSEEELSALEKLQSAEASKRREHLAFVMNSAMCQLAHVMPMGNG